MKRGLHPLGRELRLGVALVEARPVRRVLDHHAEVPAPVPLVDDAEGDLVLVHQHTRSVLEVALVQHVVFGVAGGAGVDGRALVFRVDHMLPAVVAAHPRDVVLERVVVQEVLVIPRADLPVELLGLLVELRHVVAHVRDARFGAHDRAAAEVRHLRGHHLLPRALWQAVHDLGLLEIRELRLVHVQHQLRWHRHEGGGLEDHVADVDKPDRVVVAGGEPLLVVVPPPLVQRTQPDHRPLLALPLLLGPLQLLLAGLRVVPDPVPVEPRNLLRGDVHPDVHVAREPGG
eukprot:CAMPEP_0168668648 /NCGR_PEP_ID=MMETSP0503-20121227/20691_1 /TAXON_ID=89963 /ORGANISM="Heterocapsa rotundata, Strain SCCAP K-0483" /LENGTH=287 /DNA_ID=CAMNT_0008712877 /DNA_START=61 /DNA_END=924 /DNA_ORIENTATION=+